MDNELWEVLKSFKAAIDMCMDKVEQIDKMYEDYKQTNDERIHQLESTLYDEIINPTKEYIDETNRNSRFDEFTSKYGEKLGAYNDDMRALEGDDFDLTRAAFDKYDSFDGEKPDEDTFIDALVSEIESQIGELKHKLGLPEDADVTVKQEDGETKVEVEGQEVATEGEAEVEPEEKEVEADEGEEPEADSPEAIAEYEEELKKQLK